VGITIVVARVRDVSGGDDVVILIVAVGCDVDEVVGALVVAVGGGVVGGGRGDDERVCVLLDRVGIGARLGNR